MKLRIKARETYIQLNCANIELKPLFFLPFLCLNNVMMMMTTTIKMLLLCYERDIESYCVVGYTSKLRFFRYDFKLLREWIKRIHKNLKKLETWNLNECSEEKYKTLYLNDVDCSILWNDDKRLHSTSTSEVWSMRLFARSVVLKSKRCRLFNNLDKVINHLALARLAYFHFAITRRRNHIITRREKIIFCQSSARSNQQHFHISSIWWWRLWKSIWNWLNRRKLSSQNLSHTPV